MALTQEDFFDDDLLKEFPELAGALSESAEGAFPDEGLSAEEQRKLTTLTSQAKKLQPIQLPGEVGSTQISGNPFSFDVSPVINAVQDGITKVMNARKQKKRLGDPEKAAEFDKKAERGREIAENLSSGEETPALKKALLKQAEEFQQKADQSRGIEGQITELQEKKAQGQQAEQARDELIQRMFPDIAGRLVEMKKQLTTADEKQKDILQRIEERTGAKLEVLDDEQLHDLDVLDKELTNELTKIAFETQQAKEGGRDVTSGDINNFRQITSDMTGVIDSDIAKRKVDLNSAKARAQSDRLDEKQRKEARENALKIQQQINQLENQKQNILNTTFQRAAQQLNMSVDDVKSLYLGNEEDQGGAGGNGGDQGGGGVNYEDLLN